mmetsp:Transcript_41473/g.107448  ORF Transcript_41473/g.107448 Transcript_41473/m.107448 type:complete len:457 (-) Transcript_41473:434-1804(-)|eukprot:CAMPEP_0113917222 /NCGR_PEP_ID=MMETSP0780_2-20120614/32600_1 /TAXON_ID=652834 /ORGANISM="Palpitomonas bilix" /LENGTH=456 /DNA_ID=CAMNT_0000916743 /DNA_START=191 /DNA_END=1561 /DNA_ORIENTATION=+ /assembly_acc=CAM_ASM_000599
MSRTPNFRDEGDNLRSSSLIQKFLVEEAQPRKQSKGKKLRITYQPLGGSANPNRPQSAHDRLVDSCVMLPEHDEKGKSVSKATVFFKGSENPVAEAKRKNFIVPVAFSVQETEEELRERSIREKQELRRSRPWSAKPSISTSSSRQSSREQQIQHGQRSARPGSAPRSHQVGAAARSEQVRVPLRTRPASAMPTRSGQTSARKSARSQAEEKRSSLREELQESVFLGDDLQSRTGHRPPPLPRNPVYGPTLKTGRVRTRPDFQAPATPQVHTRAFGHTHSTFAVPPSPHRRLPPGMEEGMSTQRPPKQPLFATKRRSSSRTLYERDVVRVENSEILEDVVPQLPPPRYEWDGDRSPAFHRPGTVTPGRKLAEEIGIPDEVMEIVDESDFHGGYGGGGGGRYEPPLSMRESSSPYSTAGTNRTGSARAKSPQKNTRPVGFRSHLEDRYGSKTYAIST